MPRIRAEIADDLTDETGQRDRQRQCRQRDAGQSRAAFDRNETQLHREHHQQNRADPVRRRHRRRDLEGCDRARQWIMTAGRRHRQNNRNDPAQQKRRQREPDRRRHLFGDDVQHRTMTLIGSAEIALDEPAEIAQILHHERRIEAVFGVDLGELRGGRLGEGPGRHVENELGAITRQQRLDAEGEARHRPEHGDRPEQPPHSGPKPAAPDHDRTGR
jgi:hypothetical protein